MNDVHQCRRIWRHADPFVLHFRQPGFSWLAFMAGIIFGFVLTVLANIAAKLTLIVVAVFGTGFLAGRFWRR